MVRLGNKECKEEVQLRQQRGVALSIGTDRGQPPPTTWKTSVVSSTFFFPPNGPFKYSPNSLPSRCLPNISRPSHIHQRSSAKG